MRRDAVRLAEIISSIERIVAITSARSAAEIEDAPDRRDAVELHRVGRGCEPGVDGVEGTASRGPLG
jgi:hypothetical protein